MNNSKAEKAVRIRGLTKRFGLTEAIDSLDLTLAQGEFLAVFGPNGAGKTTFIRILSTLMKPTSGKVIINGHELDKEPVAAKGVVGFIPDRPYLYEKLTGEEFLRFMAGLYGVDGEVVEARITELLRFFDDIKPGMLVSKALRLRRA